ncbi:TPA: hypothetical protein ACIBS5_002866 [Salmonella enterica subsp. diarizonae serovar 60-67:z35:-]
MDLYDILKKHFRTNAAIGRYFPKKGKPRSSQAVGKWRNRGVPDDVAILCHLDSKIPYTYPDFPYRPDPETSPAGETDEKV